MQVQSVQNNNYNPFFRANKINVDIKLKLSDVTEYLRKKVPESELKSVDLNDMFIKANLDKKNDDKVAVLTGKEIYEFFEIAWKKMGETSQDIYYELHTLVNKMRNDMWKSIERKLTPEQQEEMKNMINLQKKYSKEMAQGARKVTNLSQDESGNVTPEQIKKAEEDLHKVTEQYQDISVEIFNFKYDINKLDKTKYVDLGKV